MILKTEQEDIELEWEESPSSYHRPRFLLERPMIVLGNYHRYQEIHLNDSLIGSKRFMDGDLDVMLFSKSNFLLQALEIEIMPGVEIQQTEFTFQSSPIKNLKTIHKDGFWLPQTAQTIYYEGNDAICLYYKHFDQDSPFQHAKIREDLYAFHQEEVIVGWGLGNSSTYLYDLYHKSFDPPHPERQQLLTRFFALYKYETFDTIEKPEVIEKYRQLYIEAKEQNAQVICRTILGWLHKKEADLL